MRHKIIMCERCNRKVVINAELETNTCPSPCNCFQHNVALSHDTYDNKLLYCPSCVFIKYVEAAKYFFCDHNGMNSLTGRSVQLSIDVSRKVDVMCKIVNELKTMVAELIDMVKYHPSLKGPGFMTHKTILTSNNKNNNNQNKNNNKNIYLLCSLNDVNDLANNAPSKTQSIHIDIFNPFCASRLLFQFKNRHPFS